ncbi:MAG: M3 family oligoendopeptidase [Oscillospiraceae bacterium]
MKFSNMEYTRPNAEQVLKTFDDLMKKFDGANDADEQYEIIFQADKVASQVHSMASISYIRYTINTADAFYETEKTFFDGFHPQLDDKTVALGNKVLDSKFRKELEQKLKPIYFKNLEIERLAFSPKIIPLMQEENRLCSEYTKLTASAQIAFEGQVLNLSELGKYKVDADRTLRKKAHETEGMFYLEHREKLDDIFELLVKNRTEQAVTLGFKNYVELGYLRRTRNCYNQQDVAKFRQQVITEFVPKNILLKQKQAERLGVSDFKYYDDSILFLDGNPTPIGTPEQIMESGRKMYREMSPKTAEFIDFMLDNELFDTVAKKGKSMGGYCTYISQYKAPFIFSNFNGTSGDVDVLTHEVGHALNHYLTKDFGFSPYESVTYETAEVHSMAMEFLTNDWFPLFFGDEADKYRKMQLEDAFFFIPYGCMVDHFQHIVYEQTDLTPDGRRKAWAELEKQYRPYIDFDKLPFYGDGGGWQRQSHIYKNPFYYIYYCLAQSIALQLKQLMDVDFKKAWETYLAFSEKGGTLTFLELIETAGLASPFADGTMQKVAQIADCIL